MRFLDRASCFASVSKPVCIRAHTPPQSTALFSEEVCFVSTLYVVSRSPACSTDCKTVSKCSVPGFSCVILFYQGSDMVFLFLPDIRFYCMSWCFWSDHCYIYGAGGVMIRSGCAVLNPCVNISNVTFLMVWFDVFIAYRRSSSLIRIMMIVISLFCSLLLHILQIPELLLLPMICFPSVETDNALLHPESSRFQCMCIIFEAYSYVLNSYLPGFFRVDIVYYNVIPVKLVSLLCCKTFIAYLTLPNRRHSC